jgi:hypothetical protein
MNDTFRSSPGPALTASPIDRRVARGADFSSGLAPAADGTTAPDLREHKGHSPAEAVGGENRNC